MQVKIQSIHFDADQKLLDFIQEKVDKLGHYYDGVMGGEVFLRLEKSKDTSNKVAEIKIHTQTGELFAKKQCKSFEEAVTESTDALRIQVKKHKEKVKQL
ncbi:MAG TPA: ribosome-associated translation inhibitor RaiA [Bacteroidia bacterium]|jgi:putative sigma-54 modulation protein|nr:ribosome-associated translation inhibitor RaiA [Bacteroidia bacterium]